MATKTTRPTRKKSTPKLDPASEPQTPGAPPPKPAKTAYTPVITADGKFYYPAYRLESSIFLDPRSLEAVCFRQNLTPEIGGLGKFRHFTNLYKQTWPRVEWDPWFTEKIRSLTDEEFETVHGDSRYRFISWTGCGSAGKTFTAAAFACLWWWLDPGNSIVILTSTTKEMLAKRIWPVIQQHYFGSEDPDTGERLPWGHMIDSRKIIKQSPTGDEKHAIFAMAVAHGETTKAVENLKGMHAKRILLVIDEANATPEAIFQTIRNMRKGCQEFICLRIGNAVAHLDNHGRCCEPLDGWPTVTVENELWQTAPVPEWDIEQGWCFHFDGAKSPNVKAGKNLYPYIYTVENWDRAQRNQDTPLWWSQERGFWPPDGLLHTVLNMPLIHKYQGTERFAFVREGISVAFIDPAFGGDDCVLALGRVGDLEDGRRALLLLPPKLIVPKLSNSLVPYDHQIVEDVLAVCRQEGVTGENLGTDATGIGKGVAALLYSKFSPDVLRLEWGGFPSDLPASPDDPRKAREVYDRRVTELWFNVRTALIAGLLRGLDRETCVDFSSRTYDLIDRKLRVMTKEDCKKFLGRSPDRGDAVSGLVELCRQRGYLSWGEPVLKTEHDRIWDRKARELDAEWNGHFIPEDQLGSDIEAMFLR